MKWAVLLGYTAISGGTFVIFEHSLYALKNGIDVYIITENKVHKEDIEWHPESRKLNWLTFKEASCYNFDIAIATWWKTSYEICRIKATTYAYFVQSIESRFYGDNELAIKMFADATYLIPFKIVTEATWIKNYLFERFNQEALLVLNGIRKDIYSNTGEAYEKRNENKLRVLIEGPIDIPFKNVAKTIELATKSQADEIWLLTTSNEINRVKGVDRIFSKVPITETPKIYRSCDVIVKLSYVEGMFGPPLEMFHCGGTAITYDVTGHEEYLKDGYNALVVKTDDELEVINCINRLKNDRILLNRLKAGALKTANDWSDWDKSSFEFLSAMDKIYSLKPVSQEQITNISKILFDFYKLTENKESIDPLLNFKLYIKNNNYNLYRILRRINRLVRRGKDGGKE